MQISFLDFSLVSIVSSASATAANKALGMPLAALLVQTACIFRAAFVHARSAVMAECRWVVKQGVFHIPIVLLCADGEFEVFFRYRIPVLVGSEVSESL